MPPADRIAVPGRPETGTAITADAGDITGAVQAASHFRIYLGVAAGVGKTIAMLDEGHRRRAHGADVVIAFVEAHGWPVTESRIGTLEIVPRRVVDYRGNRFEEMDVDAVMRRHLAKEKKP